MPDARCTRSLVCAIGSKYAHEYSQRATGNHPTFPHAMVYGLYRALPGDRLSCHRRLQKICKLDAGVEASGPPVFAVRQISALVSRTAGVHRISPRVRDDRERPSVGTRRRWI